jgi:hypothetical protein
LSSTSPNLSLSELQDWLRLLSGSDEGIIKIINLYFSVKYRLIKPSFLRSFLAECMFMRSRTANEALKHFDDVCGRDNCYFAVCAVDHASLSSNSTLVTVMNSITFTQHVLGRPKKRVKSVLPAKPKLNNDTDEKIYRDTITKITSSNNWYKDTGTLGKPFPDPKHVWFSDWSYVNREIQVNPNVHTEATKVRDILGLIGTANETYLLAIQFSSANLHAISNVKVARPGFADLGNKRFAVHLDRAPRNVYQEGWGLTVHLEKLKARPPEAINGAPERICTPIPIQHIDDSIVVKPLGWVKGTRGQDTGVDDDKTFIKRLCGRRKIESIKNRILKVANKP